MKTVSKLNMQLHTISGLVSNTNEGGIHLEKKKIKRLNNCYCPDAVPKRFFLSFLGILVTTLSWAYVANLNFAIVYMVDRSNSTINNVQSSNECLANIAVLDFRNENEPEPKGEFYWSPETEGIAIAAVAYGQLIGYAPGGRLAEVYGGKLVLIISMVLTSIFTCLSAEAARLSVYAFIACRFLVGFVRGPVLPSVFYLMTKWTPKTERNFTISVIFSGYGLGVFVVFLAGGELCASTFLGGWPSMFYVFGFCGIIWCLLCYLFLYETPEDHPTITAKELDFISNNLGPRKNKKIDNIPWKSIMKSVPFWSIAIGYIGQSWIFSFFIIVQPIYMGTILNLDSVKNGQLSCLPQLIKALICCICGYPIDWALNKKYVSVELVRKGSTVLNSVCCCLGIIGILFSGCDPTWNTVFFTLGGLAVDFMLFGVVMNGLDIAPDLAGTINGLFTTVTNFPALIIPALIGYVTKHERSMAQWRYVYYWTIGIVTVTTIIYVIFGTSEPQSWGCKDKENMKEVKQENVEIPKENVMKEDSGPTRL